MLTIDKYAYHNRLLEVNPLIKLVLYLLLLGIAFSGVPGLQWAEIGCLLPITCYTAKIHWKSYFRWLAWPLPFVLVSLVTIMVSFKQELSQNIIALIPFFKGYLVTSEEAVRQAGVIFVRTYACLSSTYFFILTVPFRQLADLFRRLHLSKELLEVMLLMYRFIFMFLQEFMTMRDTLDLKFAFGNLRQSCQSMGLLASQLFTKLMRANAQLSQVLQLHFDD